MRILIDTTYARRAPQSGTGVYVAQLLAALGELDGVEMVRAFNRRRSPPGGGGRASARNLISDLWWGLEGLPRLARRAHADLIHHPLPPLVLAPGVPQVITVHDLAPARIPADFDPRWGALARIGHRAAARRAGAVICVSRTTAADVRELWDVDPERLVIALHGPGQISAFGSSEPSAGSNGSAAHFLYVGDAEPRKNLPLLVAAYARYREQAADPRPLVVAGSAQLHGDGIRLAPAPGPGGLEQLLRGAAALVQPSRYEGFGLTALEAMAAGTPVLAARSPGLTEVCGDAALFAETDNAGALTQALIRIGSDDRLRHELARRGRARARQFSWAASARAHRGAYSQCVRPDHRSA